MQAFRIVKKRHILTAFSGEGARAFGGRWNRPGIPMVHAAQTRALAALEALAHFAGAERRIPFVAFAIEVPDALVMRAAAADLPAGWRHEEPDTSTQEFCLLLNPDHPDARKVMVGYPEPFQLDGRR